MNDADDTPEDGARELLEEQPPTLDEVEELIDAIVTAQTRAERARAQAKAIAERNARRVQWLADRAAEVERELMPRVRAYYEAHPPRGSRTLHTLAGSVQMRRVPARASISDAEACTAWARSHLPAAVRVRTTETIAHDIVTEHIRATGEVPPGVEMIDEMETLTVKPAKEKP